MIYVSTSERLDLVQRNYHCPATGESGQRNERGFVKRLGRILLLKEDGRRAILYEIISGNTSEERIARRRRD